MSVYQRVNLPCAECQGAADIVFAIDVSGSIRQERFDQVREFLVSIVENMEVYNDKVRVGALIFSDSATLQFRLNERSSRQDIVQVSGATSRQSQNILSMFAVLLVRCQTQKVCFRSPDLRDSETRSSIAYHNLLLFNVKIKGKH